MNIKPIETIYNGYRFRSRLEARWAYALDLMEINWIYEGQGYILPDGTWYLPDFYLPESEWFVEVKSDMKRMNKEEVNKIKQFDNNPPNNAWGIFTLTSLEETQWNNIPFIQRQLLSHAYKGDGDFDEIYNNSVLKAKQSRFEFGETP